MKKKKKKRGIWGKIKKKKIQSIRNNIFFRGGNQFFFRCGYEDV